MTERYQDALALFGIQSGFVEEQIEKVYDSLKELHKPEDFALLSPEYLMASNKQRELASAYYCLYKPFSHYIVNQNSNLINEEQMIDEVSKLIYDYSKKGKIVNKEFITKLVEILLSFKSLNQYIRDIEFHAYDKNSICEYGNGTLTVYEQNLKDSIVAPYWFEEAEKSYYPYYQTVATIYHEVKHANHEKIAEQGKNDIYSFLWQACNVYKQIDNESFSRIVSLPSPIFEIMNALLGFKTNQQYRKYRKYWLYCPDERVAEICGNSLALTLIEQAPNKKELKNMLTHFSELVVEILFFGYDKLLGPTDFYLSKFKQYKDCLKLSEMSKSLSVEERLLLGLYVTANELESAKKDKEKILSGVRQLC